MDGKPEEQILVDIGNEELNPHDNTRRDFVANV